MVIYSGFSHEKWWFSVAMLVYQMVDQIGFLLWLYVTVASQCLKQNTSYRSPNSSLFTAAIVAHWRSAWEAKSARSVGWCAARWTCPSHGKLPRASPGTGSRLWRGGGMGWDPKSRKGGKYHKVPNFCGRRHSTSILSHYPILTLCL